MKIKILSAKSCGRNYQLLEFLAMFMKNMEGRESLKIIQKMIWKR